MTTAAPESATSPQDVRGGDIPTARRLFIALFSLQLVLALTHVPARDEIQAFLIARGSETLGTLIANLRNEGHPALWHMLLWTLAFLDPTPRLLNLVQVAVSITSLGLIWFRAPFSAWTRLLFASGYFILFEYGTLARSYGLGTLLLLAFLSFRQNRLAWVALALMANISLHFAMLSGLCALMMLRDGQRWWPGLLIWGLGGLMAVVTMWPAADTVPAVIGPADAALRLAIGVIVSSTVVFPTGFRSIWFQWGGQLPQTAALVVGAFLPVLGWLCFPRSWSDRALFLLIWAGTLGIAVVVYPGFTRHVGVLFLAALALTWIRAERGERLAPAFQAWAGLLTGIGLWAAATSLVIPFAAARMVTDWVREARLGDAPWAAHPAWLGTELSAALDRPLFNAEKECLETFQRWNYATLVHEAMTRGVLLASLTRAAARTGGTIHLLTDRWMDDSETLTLLQIFPPGLADGGLTFIYRLTAPPDPDAIPLPRCP